MADDAVDARRRELSRAPKRSLTTGLEVPERLSPRPTWRGIPIPYIVPLPEDWTPEHPNRPAFEVTDPLKWQTCVTERRCGVCGQRLDYWIFFIGGPLSIENRLFNDPAMHEECALFSIEVCPYLSGAVDHANAAVLERREERDKVKRGIQPNVSDEAPDRIGMGRTRDYSTRSFMNRDAHGIPRPSMLILARPFKEVRWFDREREGDG